MTDTQTDRLTMPILERQTPLKMLQKVGKSQQLKIQTILISGGLDFQVFNQFKCLKYFPDCEDIWNFDEI